MTLSVNGYIKRSSQSVYAEQRRGGFGKRGMRTRNEDSVQDLFLANTHSDLLVFTGHGWVYKLPVYEVPEVGRDARGTPIVNLVPIQSGDTIRAVLSIQDFEGDIDLVFCSTQGLVKRTRLGDYRNIRSNGLRAYDCADGDELLTVVQARLDQQLLLVTRDGMSIRFDGSQVRQMGRVARGVRGIKLRAGDAVAGAIAIEDNPELTLLTITENGFGKRTVLSEYSVQNRGGQGLIDIVTDDRNGQVAGALLIDVSDRIMLITDTGRVGIFCRERVELGRSPRSLVARLDGPPVGGQRRIGRAGAIEVPFGHQLCRPVQREGRPGRRPVQGDCTEQNRDDQEAPCEVRAVSGQDEARGAGGPRLEILFIEDRTVQHHHLRYRSQPRVTSR